MPSLDGLSLIESIVSSDGPNSKTPIIVISAYLSKETEDTLRSHGVIECLSKPFEAERLLDLVQRCHLLTSQTRSIEFENSLKH